MKTIKIFFNKKGGFEIEHYETEDDRKDFEDKPHPYGFYHYPDKIQTKTAFGRLKKVMIEDMEKRLDDLRQEIKLLKNLKYE